VSRPDEEPEQTEAPEELSPAEKQRRDWRRKPLTPRVFVEVAEQQRRIAEYEQRQREAWHTACGTCGRKLPDGDYPVADQRSGLRDYSRCQPCRTAVNPEDGTE
jgi:hypothetical protein